MALKDMALTPEEAKAEYGECAPCGMEEGDGPKYPWGLSICLANEALAKLGMGLLPVGTKVMIMAEATVTGTSSRERVKGQRQEDMDIQIQALDISRSSSADERQGQAATKLYPGT